MGRRTTSPAAPTASSWSASYLHQGQQSSSSCVSGQIAGPVLAARRSLAVANMHFGRDASPGPTDPRGPWRAPLLAHGAALPCGHVWSRNRRQREAGSCFLPSAWSGFDGALCPAGRRETIVRWLISRGKSLLPRATSFGPRRRSPGRLRRDAKRPHEAT